MIAAGRYRAKALNVALGRTKSGKEQIGIELELLDEQERITWYGYFTPGALPHAVKAMRACGWKGDDVSDLSGIVGTEVSLVIEQEEYNGRVSAKVKWINAAGGLAMKDRIDGAAAKDLAARLKPAIASLGQFDAPSGGGSDAPIDDAPPPDDDGIPF